MLARKIVPTILIFVVVCVGLIAGSRTQAVVNTGVGYLTGTQAWDAQAVTPVDAGTGSGWLKTPADPNAGKQPNYKPDEIIVKFKKPVSDTVEQQLAGKATSKKLKLTKSLENLGSKHKVKSIEPVFKDFKANRERINNLLKKDTKSLSRDEKRILRRQKRAPKDVKVPELDRIYIVKLEEGQSVEQAVADYSKDPAVEYAELNYLVSICLTPNDPNYPVQWALNNIGQMYPASWNYRTPPGAWGCDINAPEAWDLSPGSQEVVVAVIDTGVDYNHRDMQGNMWTDANGHHGYDFVNNDNDPVDDMGHGTHCAGIIAARGNNGLDISGVCWNAKIMSVKILDATGSGSLDNGAKGIRYAVDHEADVLSNSWGWGTQPEDEGSNTVREAIQYAVSQGAIVVAAAGNSGVSDSFYPANYDHVISVAATDSNDDMASFSNYGSWVDIAAPGVDILSLRAFRTGMGNFYGDKLTIASGTSMACPHVAGACALLLSVNPYLSSDDVNTILKNSADILKDTSICASGRLDIYRAILQVNSSKGYINLDRSIYGCDSNIGILVGDYDLAESNSCDINLTCGGDLEVVTLYAVSPGVGIFTGSIHTGSGDPSVNDGVLQVADGQIITATYYDLNNGSGNTAEPNDTATVDCNYPVISDVFFAEELIGPEQVVTFQTSKLTTARIICGTSCGEPNIVAEYLNPQLSHTIKFKGMEPLTNYYFEIEVTDLAGNTTVDFNSGNCYWFVTDEGPRDINVPADYNTIQGAIDAAWDGSTIWLADGNYTGTGNRDVDFKGKAVILRSINGPNNCIIDCQGTPSNPHRAFIFQNDEGPTSVLQGLTVINGNDTIWGGGGGAIVIKYSSPRIENCIFKGNSAVGGGVVYSLYGSEEFNNCTFTENSAYVGGAIWKSGGEISITRCLFSKNTGDNAGGAILALISQTTINNSTFSENSSTGSGGGIFARYAILTINNCIFTGNSSNGSGGGVYGDVGLSCPITNSIFKGNTTSGNGGGLCIGVVSTSEITNCTFFGNNAISGNGGGIFTWDMSTSTVINSIIWGNEAGVSGDEVITDESWSWSYFSYCDINGCGGSGAGWNSGLGFDLDSGGNIDENPLFTDTTLHISNDSPCADAGDPYGNYNGQTDIDGEPRVQGLYVDIGADETIMRVHNVNGGKWYLQLQDAISDANNGDKIVVYPATYYESVNLNGKDITVQGADPNNLDVIQATIINGNGATNVVETDSNATLKGLTIIGGQRGIYCLGGTHFVTHCIVRNNSDKGIYAESATLTIKNSLIYDNNEGISLQNTEGTIQNDTIVDNTSFGIRVTDGNGPSISNCILWNNSDDLSGCSATYSCIEDVNDANGTGNITSDPYFVNAYSNNFHINNNSLCIDAGDPNGDYDGQTDIDGEPRLRNQYVDIGADEVWRRVHNITNGNWYLHIQDAINEASSGDEIVVSIGTYYEEINFNGKAITIRGSDPNNWDTVAATVIDCQGNWNSPSRGVAFENGEDGNSVLEGITITHGFGPVVEDLFYYYAGGAVLCHNSSPTIRRCLFRNNGQDTYDDSFGGAIACYYSNALIEECAISDNISAYGGAIGVVGGAPIIKNCSITGNIGLDGGGAVAAWDNSELKITNCTILNNSAYWGGAIESEFSSPVITNCVISKNSADYYAGTMYIYQSSSTTAPTITNCTFVNNSSNDIGGIYRDASFVGLPLVITNCILWGNGDDLAGCSATYSCIEDNDAGTGNIHSDPCFVDADGNDFHIASNSLCIDAGDSNVVTWPYDIDGQPRIYCNAADIGADEVEATPTCDCLYAGKVFLATAGSPTLTVTQTMIDMWVYLGKPSRWCCEAQKRGNGIYTGSSATKVDAADLGAVKNANAWMKTYTQPGYNPCLDFDLSGIIDGADEARIKDANNWGHVVGGCP